MNLDTPEFQTRDPFQFELLQAVQKRRKQADDTDNNNNDQKFDGLLNAKMSKHSAKMPAEQTKKSPYVFASQDGDEDDDDCDIVITGRKGELGTSMHSTDLNLPQKNNSSSKKGLHNSMERDSFLNAFLDRDANLNHEPLPFKSHDGTSDNNKEAPTPRPRPTPRKDIAANNRHQSIKEHTQNEQHEKNKKLLPSDKRMQEDKNKNEIYSHHIEPPTPEIKKTREYDREPRMQDDNNKSGNRHHGELQLPDDRYGGREDTNLKNSVDSRGENDFHNHHQNFDKRHEKSSIKSQMLEGKLDNTGENVGKKLNDSMNEVKREQLMQNDSKQVSEDIYSANLRKFDKMFGGDSKEKTEVSTLRSETNSKNIDEINSFQIGKSGNDSEKLSSSSNKVALKSSDRNKQSNAQQSENNNKEIKESRRESLHNDKVKSPSNKRESLAKDRKTVREFPGTDQKNVRESLAKDQKNDGKSSEKDQNNVKDQKNITESSAKGRKNTTESSAKDRKNITASSAKDQKNIRETPAPRIPRNASIREPDGTYDSGTRATFSSDGPITKEHSSEVISATSHQLDRSPRTPKNANLRDDLNRRTENTMESSNYNTEHRDHLQNASHRNQTVERSPKKSPLSVSHAENKRNTDMLGDHGNRRKTMGDEKDRASFDSGKSPRQKNKLTRQIAEGKHDDGAEEDLDDLFAAQSQKPTFVKRERMPSAKNKMSPGSKSSAVTSPPKVNDTSPKVEKKVKKGPLKANLPIELATKSSVVANDGKKDKDTRKKSTLSHKTKSLSYTNISNIHMSPRSKSPSTYDMSKLDAGTLREQIYADWLQRKHSFTKDQSKKGAAQRQEEEEEKERLKKERQVDAQKSFEAWTSGKSDALQTRNSEMKKKAKFEKEKGDEQLQKKLEAVKFFDSWKQHKDVELKEKQSKKRKEEREKKNKEISQKIEKAEDGKKIFERWKVKKDEQLKATLKEKRLEKKKVNEEELDKQERKQQAQRSYAAWKESATSRPSSATLKQRPWCPSSRQRASGIPETVQPVIVRNPPTGNRTRTLSASARLQTNTKRSK